MSAWLATATWDEWIGVGILLSCLLSTALYLGRYFFVGRARSARVDQQGASLLLNQFSKELGYWALTPGADLLLKLGLSANQISWASLAFGIGAAGAIIAGHFGLAALLSLLAMVFDVFDGMVARKVGTFSDAGEVLDATLDRYVEFLFLGALVIYYRTSLTMMGVSLAACFGSFMVSYSTAKAEAMRIAPPPTSMRRPERAVLMVLGATLTAVTGRFENPGEVFMDPLAIATIWIAVGSNVAAPIRLYRIAKQLRAEGR